MSSIPVVRFCDGGGYQRQNVRKWTAGSKGGTGRSNREMDRHGICPFSVCGRSAAYLKRFEVVGIKIDRTFVRELTDSRTNAKDRAIIAAAVDVAKAFVLKVIAEGIENSGTALQLINLGITAGQGYFYAWPMPTKAIAWTGSPITSSKVKQSPAGAMTEWLQTNEAPSNFTVDSETELKATGENKSSVKHVSAMETKQLQEHIAGGKCCTRLALTWDDKISFVLTDALTIKKVALLDVLKENYDDGVDNAGRFEADFALMTGEVAKMLAVIVGPWAEKTTSRKTGYKKASRHQRRWKQ